MLAPKPTLLGNKGMTIDCWWPSQDEYIVAYSAYSGYWWSQLLSLGPVGHHSHTLNTVLLGLVYYYFSKE